MFEDDDFMLDEPVETVESEVMDDDTAFELGFNEDLPKVPEQPVEVEPQPFVPEVDPKAAFLDEMAKQFGMDADEYMAAYQEYQQEQEVLNLVEQGVSEEAAREILELRHYKQQKAQEVQIQEKEQKDRAIYNEFFDWFRQTNQREFDPRNDEIPSAAWLDVEQGKSLKEAYQEHYLDQMFLKGFMEG